MQTIENVEQDAEHHAHHAGQHHALELDLADVHADAGKADDEDDSGHDDVAVFAEIHLGIHQDPQAGRADHAVQQDRDAAHNRAGGCSGSGLQRGR